MSTCDDQLSFRDLLFKVSAYFMNNSGNLCYSRVEVAVDTRHSARCCGRPPLLRCNEVDAVRSARPEGKRCRHVMISYPLEIFCLRCRRIL